MHGYGVVGTEFLAAEAPDAAFIIDLGFFAFMDGDHPRRTIFSAIPASHAQVVIYGNIISGTVIAKFYGTRRNARMTINAFVFINLNNF